MGDVDVAAHLIQLEKIRLSITRLKQFRGIGCLNDACPWKDKTLDYEIETLRQRYVQVRSYGLEKIRLSITRLKQEDYQREVAIETLTWKDKTLDYEIETADVVNAVGLPIHTWKDKTLDYEIETHWACLYRRRRYSHLEKIRLSITRLKQITAL